jgi:hydroxymethylbilane synthase
MTGAAGGKSLRIGTRSSELALHQARLVQAALDARGVRTELIAYETTGDKRLDTPLAEIGGKGLFTKELEDDLRDGLVDCCVHSLKDMPTDQPYGLEIIAELPREDPRDALVVRAGGQARTLADLPAGARVGTSSLRRRAQLRALRPDLEVEELRGNVPTRLRKLDAGEVDAAILAAAGLLRLGRRDRITAYLEPPEWLPAAGQGVIAVQARGADDELRALLEPLHDVATMIATRAERTFLAACDGGCQVPIGVLLIGDTLHGMISAIDGSPVVRGSHAIDRESPEVGAMALAEELLGAGGIDILRVLRDGGEVPSPQPE